MPSFPIAHRFTRPPRQDEDQGGGPVPRTESPVVRVATESDIRFVDHLQKKFANCVGFLPKIAIENIIAQGSMRIAMENDDAAGYILSRPNLKWQPLMRSITQACVAMDAQRRHHGLALLQQIEAESRAAGLVAIQACCAVGLESNSFWHAAGFRPVVHMTPENVRGREIICWRKPLGSVVPSWFTALPRRAGYIGRRPQSTRDTHRSMDAITTARQFITVR
jgi:N-acetylglutamate synthase-like GNAT family acetyltransferase